jgi:hypothetical protein
MHALPQARPEVDSPLSFREGGGLRMDMSFDRILGLAGIGLGVLGIVIGVGVAIAMDPKSKGELIFSVSCFIVSALLLCLTIGTWGFLSTASTSKRILISFPAFAVICVSMMEASRWAEGRYERAGVEKKPEVQAQSSPSTASPGDVRDSEATDHVQATPKTNLTKDQATPKVGHPNPPESKQSVLHSELLPKIAEDVGEIKKNVVPVPRHLSEEQRIKLVFLLRSGGPYETAVRHTQGNLESQTYADEFVAVLQGAGWTVNPTPRFLIQERDAAGVWIMVSDMAKAPPCALLLQQSLKAVGIEAPGMAVPGISPTPETACELFVGLKPT